MRKPIKKGRLLAQTVLASTLFVNQLSYALVIAGSYNEPVPDPQLSTSIQGNIQITATGRVTSSTPLIPAIQVNDANRTITLDPNNVTVAAPANSAIVTGGTDIFLCDAGGLFCSVVGTGNNATISIGENTDINGNLGIGIAANNSTTNNAGNILGDTGIFLFGGILNTKITNEETGLILASGNPLAIGIIVGSDVTLNNLGTIESNGPNKGPAILFATPPSGTLTNSGTIVNNSPLSAAIELTGTITQITNSGTIQNNNASATINAFAPTVITNGIFNTGNIQNLGGADAINLNNPVTSAPVFQQGGTIKGNILLDTVGGKNFTMTGGTVIGNVTANGAASDILALNDGQITGNVNLANNNDTVNLGWDPVTLTALPGTAVLGAINGGTGNDTFNVGGGSFAALNGGLGADFLGIFASFVANGPITLVETISINTPGTIFTLNQPITFMDTSLTINANTVFVDNANISGTNPIVQNNGSFIVNGTRAINLGVAGKWNNNNGSTFTLSNTANLTLTSSTFTHNAGANLRVELQSPAVFGKMNAVIPGVNSVSLAANSFISPIPTSFIPDGSIYNIIVDTAGGTIQDNSTLIQPFPNTLLFFTKQVIGGTLLQLEAHRTPFTNFSGSPVTQGIAENLTLLASGNGPTNPTLIELLNQFQGLPNGQAIEDAMQSLIPPFNNGLIAGSKIPMDITFEGVQDRLQYFHFSHRKRNRYTGISYGDFGQNGGAWARVLGAHLDQKNIDNVSGYKANGVGGALGLDWEINDCTSLGLAGSYTEVKVTDKALNPKDEKIENLMIAGYGWFEFFCHLYLDLMFGVARDDVSLTRAIGVNQLTGEATAAFRGSQYGTQGDLGWSFENEDHYYVAPFIRLKYTRLSFNDYVEQGAGEINLHVSNQPIEEFLTGIGARVGALFVTETIWIPAELVTLLAYDIRQDGEQTLANFVGGGVSFLTPGVKPGRVIFNAGFNLHGKVTPIDTISLRYILELRSHFLSNAAYLQYYHEFGPPPPLKKEGCGYSHWF